MAGLRQTLSIRATQAQTLTMTPQLQQAIRLLQLSTLDLRQEIQQTLESNPLLEIDESIANANHESLDEMAERELQASDSDVYDPFNNDESYQGSDIQLSDSTTNTADLLGRDGSLNNSSEYEMTDVDKRHRDRSDNTDDSSGDKFEDISNFDNEFAGEYGSDSDFIAEFGDDYREIASDLLKASSDLNSSKTASESDLPDKIAEASMDPGSTSTLENMDTAMRDDNYSAKSRSKGAVIDDEGMYEGETNETLQDHLMWQLDCSPLQGRDRKIAEAIIDAIDDSGYLTEPLEEIQQMIAKDYEDTTVNDVAVVLKLIQHYDPVGVGARSVQECLLIQLYDKVQTDDREEVHLAIEVVKRYLDLLSGHDYRNLCSRLGVKEDGLKRINDVILSLTPRPGRAAVREKTDFIVPDVLLVKDKNGDYDVVLNPDALPRVKLNEQYKSLVCYARNEREKEFFKSNLQEANWFIQSIAKRNDTLLKVAKCIVEHQRAFLDYGEHRMEPLVLNDIAQEIEMHESTISRVTTEKYINTPRGTFELKYFFSSHVSTENGGTASSTAIRAEIKVLVANENPRRPYSDNQIANLLKEKGFCVARRTIAKYREALGIGSSSQRKRLI